VSEPRIPSLFDPADNRALLARLARLAPDAKAQWGRMSVAQMLWHCRQPLLVATGELPLKRGLIGVLFCSLARRSLTKPEPFGRNLPTAPEFRAKG